MKVRSHIVDWDGTLAIRIPKEVAERWRVREGSRINMVVHTGNQLVLTKQAYDLTEMLARMSPETLHAEVDPGPAER